MVAKTSQLVDDFSSDLTASNYPGSFGTHAVAAGVATVTANTTNTVSGLDTGVNLYDGTSSIVAVNFKPGSGGTTPKQGITLQDVSAGTNVLGTDIRMMWDGTNVVWGQRGPSYATIGTDATHALSAGTGLDIAIVEGLAGRALVDTTPGVDGNLYYYYGDGTNWHYLGTGVTPSWYSGQVKIQMLSQNSGGTSVATFDNLNTVATPLLAAVPSVVQNLTAARNPSDPSVITVNWTAPASNGGTALTNMHVGRDGTDLEGTGATSVTIPASRVTYTFANLDVTAYTFTVYAINSSGNGASATVTVPAYSKPSGGGVGTLTVLGTVSDSFDEVSLDPTFWDVVSTGVSISNGATSVDSITSTPKLLLKRGDLRNSFVMLQFGDLSKESLDPNDQIQLLARSTSDATKVVRIYYKGGILYGAYDAGSPDVLQSGIAYVPAKMVWWRINNFSDPTKVILEYSADAVTWTSLVRSGFNVPTWFNDVQAGEGAVNATVAPPSSSVPSVPLSVSRSTTGTTATITWAAPTSPGTGGPVTSYTVTRDGTGSDGQVGWTATVLPTAALSTIFAALIPGTTYTLTVTANNAAGPGATSSGTITTAASTGGGTTDVTSFTTTAPVGPAAPTTGSKAWTLDFSDDFPGTTLDTTKWVKVRPDGGTKGWGNKEWYDPSAVSVAGSEMILTMSTATDPSGSGRVYKSGLIATGVEGNPKYFLVPNTYLEARIKVPPAADGSLWPAFWGFGPFWPPEIDFFEMQYDNLGGLGAMPDHGLPAPNWHPDSTNQTNPNHNVYGTGDARGTYHTYGVLWLGTTVSFYFDGVAYPARTISGVNAAQQFIIFSHQSSGGTVNTPSLYKVDWVRVWKPQP